VHVAIGGKVHRFVFVVFFDVAVMMFVVDVVVVLRMNDALIVVHCVLAVTLCGSLEVCQLLMAAQIMMLNVIGGWAYAMEVLFAVAVANVNY